MFAILPQITSITETRAKLTTQQKEVKAINLKLQELEANRLSPEFSQVDTVNQVLPTKKPLLELMTSLNAISGLTQVTISDLKINPGQIATDSSQLRTSTVPNKNGYDSLELNLAVSGQLANIQRFLSLIEQVSPITTITKINLNRSSKVASGSAATKADLTLSVHYFTQEVKSSLMAPLPKITQREKEIFQTIQKFTIPVSDTTNQVEGGGNTNPFPVDAIEE